MSITDRIKSLLDNVTGEGTNENEPFPCTTLESSLQRLINHGTFKYVHRKFSLNHHSLNS